MLGALHAFCICSKPMWRGAQQIAHYAAKRHRDRSQIQHGKPSQHAHHVQLA